MTYTPELLPYFHHTQLVMVDNDIDFLGNLSLQLEADLAYLLFDSTTKALDYINGRLRQGPSRQRFFNMVGDKSEQPARLVLDTDALAEEMYYNDRFSQISVVMVDYAMPRMNGIEFCERVQNPLIKKILFTGVATEAEAIDAFNRGVIDRYIRKNERQVYEHLNATIRELQHEHIRDIFALADDMFDLEMPALLRDPAIIRLMDELRQRLGYVEHYLMANPGGFVLIDADGYCWRLVISDEQDIEADVASLREADAPPECIEAVQKGDALLDPALRTQPVTVRRDALRHWSACLQRADRLDGDRTYRWTLFDGLRNGSGPARPVASYNRYLEWLDTVGYSMM